jgi:hypothetical protein
VSANRMSCANVLCAHDHHTLEENVTKLTAVCQRCFKDAGFTQRLSKQTEVEVRPARRLCAFLCVWLSLTLHDGMRL